MAFMAIRILSSRGPLCWNSRVSHSAFRLQKIFASSQGSQSHEEAFWDVEGSVAVDPSSKTIQFKYVPETKKSEPIEEECDIIRITRFGHIRLDQENQAVEKKDPETPEESKDSFNFIDNQFFGDKLSSDTAPLIKQNNLKAKASDVPVDTNPVDQQYFYPSSGETDKSNRTLPAPSASELEFKENEVDDQYFGKKSSTSRQSQTPAAPVGKVSAYNYLKTLQAKEAESSKNSTEESAESGQSIKKIYEEMIPNLFKMPNEEIIHLLKKSVLYNKDGIVAIDKPHGLVTTDADGNAKVVLTNLLPGLSQALRVEKLYTVHRLDRDTTGILLLASNQTVANKLNKLFLDHQIQKKYMVITKGIPSPREGTIDIPMCEKSIGDRQRMALRPVLSHNPDSLKSAKYNAKGKSFKAVTHFKVKTTNAGAAFVELEPETGVQHQLRVHLSEGLDCPVLGDHKYSHADKYAPQKLPEDILNLLGIKQSKARNIPMHLHAAFIAIPGFGQEGQPLCINSPLPRFFRYTMKKLKLFKQKTR